MKCPRCDAEIPQGQRKCPECGSEVIFTSTEELLSEPEVLDQLEARLETISSFKTFAAGEVISDKYTVKGAREERGNFGIVYRVEEKDSGNIWALKTIYDKLTTSKEAAASLKDELAIVLSLDHPNVVTLEDYSEYNGTVYTISEYWVGVSLNKLVEARKNLNNPFSLQDIANYFEPILDAMEYTHNMQILHGDLIPSNVLIRREIDPLEEDDTLAALEEVKITDLGLFKGLYNYLPPVELMSFSFREFRAPETYSGKPALLTARADIYSLGALLYLLVFMSPPSAELEIKDANLKGRALPGRIVEILKRCMDPRPEYRYESIALLKSEWFELMQEAAEAAAPAERPALVEEPATAEIEEEVEKGAEAEWGVGASAEPEEEPVSVEAKPGAKQIPRDELIVEEARAPIAEPLEARAEPEVPEVEVAEAKPKEPEIKKRPTAVIVIASLVLLLVAAAAIAFYFVAYPYIAGIPDEPEVGEEVAATKENVVAPEREQPPNLNEPATPPEERHASEEPLAPEQPASPPPKVEPPSQEARVKELLAKAKKALDSRKLTRPPNDNAFFYYKEALRIDGNNVEAKKGLHELALALVSMGDNELEKNNLRSAERYYKTALAAVANYKPAQDGLAKIKSRREEPPPPQKPPEPPKEPMPEEESVDLENLMPEKSAESSEKEPAEPESKEEAVDLENLMPEKSAESSEEVPAEEKEEERTVEETAPPAPPEKGKIDKNAIRDAVQNNYMGRIKLCYSKGLERDPTLTGDVVIRFTIGLEGKVIAAEVASSTLPDSEVVECIRRRFLIMQFPAPKGAPVTVNYRFSFKP